LIISNYIILYFKIFKQYKQQQNIKKIAFSKNNFHIFKKFNTIKKVNFFFKNSILKNILLFLSNLFSIGINFLVIDKSHNYNYLPIKNTHLSGYNIYKTIKYFNVKVLLFLDLKPKQIKKFICFRLLNIITTKNSSYVDFFPKIQNIKVFHYIIYIHILNLYINK
jgi:hypothetical protein